VGEAGREKGASAHTAAAQTVTTSLA
jgi:hypothetical protein